MNIFQFFPYSSRFPKEIKKIFILNIQNKMFSYPVICYPNNMLLRIKLSFLALKTSDCIENKGIIIFFRVGAYINKYHFQFLRNGLHYAIEIKHTGKTLVVNESEVPDRLPTTFFFSSFCQHLSIIVPTSQEDEKVLKNTSHAKLRWYAERKILYILYLGVDIL